MKSFPTKNFVFVGVLAATTQVSCAQTPSQVPSLNASKVLASATQGAAQTPSSTRSDARAVYGAWHSSMIGGGGFVQNVIATRNPRVFYCYIDVGGVLRSDDGGRRWRMIHGSLPPGAGIYNVRDLAVDPRDENSILIACGNQWASQEGVFASKDGGKSWTKTLDGWFYGNEDFRWSGRVFARDPRNPDRIWVQSGAGLFASTDNGATWKNRGLNDVFPSDVRFSRDGKTLFVSAQKVKIWRDKAYIEYSNQGLFRSVDQGATWQKISDTAPTEMLQDPNDAKRWIGLFENTKVLQSVDGGATWTDFSQGLPQGIPNGYTSEGSFSALASGPNFLLVASQRGTFYRRDKGQSVWRKLSSPKVVEIYEGEPWISRMQPGKWQHFGAALASISVDPRDPKKWFFTDWFAIYRSEDAGATWNLSMDGLENTVLHTLAVDAGDSARVFLGMGDNGFMTSQNGGTRFQTPRVTSNTKSIAVGRSAPHRVVMTGDMSNGAWRAYQVWISADSGQSWIKSPMKGLPDMEEHSCNSVAVDPKNADVVYIGLSKSVANGGGVYVSRDGGMNWQAKNDGLPAEEIFAHNIWGIGQEIAVADDGSVAAISRDRRKVFYLAPNADKWTTIATSFTGAPKSISSTRSSFWIGVEDDGAYELKNGQIKKMWMGSAPFVAVDVNNPRRIALGTTNGVRLSVDGGAKWSDVTSALPYRYTPIPCFAGERLLVATLGNGVFWRALSPAGEKAVVAKSVAKKPIVIESKLPKIPNPQMTLGQTVPDGWKISWTGSGQLQLARDTKTSVSAPSSLRFGSEAVAQGSASLEVPLWQGDATWSGTVKSRGQLEEAQVALQLFDENWKQVGWISLFDARDKNTWTAFESKASVNAQTRHVQLVIAFKGRGEVWLDDIALRP